MSDPNVLEAVDLTVGYGGRRILGPIDLSLAPNDSVALIGPNGVGKSTILKTLAGVIPPVGGSIGQRGESISGLPVHERVRRGIVLAGEQRANVLRTLTVEENLDLARRDSARSAASPATLFPRLLERRKQLAGTLSGGEQQMLSLAMALSLAPVCLLIDEPSAGLAPVILESIRAALAELRSSGVAVVIAEQRADVVRGLCDRVAVVGGGQVRFLEAGADLAAESLANEYFRNGTARSQ